MPFKYQECPGCNSLYVIEEDQTVYRIVPMGTDKAVTECDKCHTPLKMDKNGTLVEDKKDAKTS